MCTTFIAPIYFINISEMGRIEIDGLLLNWMVSAGVKSNAIFIPSSPFEQSALLTFILNCYSTQNCIHRFFQVDNNLSDLSDKYQVI